MTMNDFEKKAMMFEEHMKKLGWTRLETGRWVEEVIDDGQGFPYIKYTCPFCQNVGNGTKYCPECGARLGE